MPKDKPLNDHDTLIRIDENIKAMLEHLKILNGRTTKNETAIWKSKVQHAKIYGGLAVCAVALPYVIEWLKG